MENYNNENDLAQQENDLSQTGSSIEQITEQNSVTEQSAHSDNDFEDTSAERATFSVSDNAYKSAPFFKSLFSLKFGDISIVHRIILSFALSILIFAVGNFVIFPAFFLSSALYPLWKMAESSVLLRDICAVNPFTHAVELIRFALYGKLNAAALGWTLLAGLVFWGLGVWGYDPRSGIINRKG